MTEHKPAKKNRLTLYIGIALLLGIVTGFLLNKYYVGEDNNKIANAEMQLKHLSLLMKPYSTAKDSSLFAVLQQQKINISSQKKKAEQSLLNTEDETTVLATIKKLTDSLKGINTLLTAQTDTVSPAYKELQKENDFIALQKNDVLKNNVLKYSVSVGNNQQPASALGGEMVTAIRYNLPVIVVIFSDGELNLIKVKQSWQNISPYGTLLYQGDLFGADIFLGLKVLRADSNERMRKVIIEALSVNEPIIINAIIDPEDYKWLIVRR